MTTVTIGSYPTRIPAEEKTVGTEELPLAEKSEAPTPAQNQEKGEEGVRVFSPSRSALPLRAVFIVRLLLAAGAGLFVWLGERFGSAELRAAIAEAVQRALNG